MKNAKSGDSIINQKSQIINSKHLTVIRHYLVHGNKTEAYRQVYTNCADSAARQSAHKLFNRADVKAYIEQEEAAAKAVVEAEIAEELKAKIFDTLKRRALLADIMTGTRKANRYFKVHGALVPIVDELPPNALLKAIELDTKIEAGWYDRKPLPGESKIMKEPPPPPKPVVNAVYFGCEPFDNHDERWPVLTEDEEKALWQLSLSHELIITPPPPLTPRQESLGMIKCKNEKTGHWYLTCPARSVEKLTDKEKSAKVSLENDQPIDNERLDNIIKNSEFITGLLNYEYNLLLFRGDRSASKQDKTATAKPKEIPADVPVAPGEQIDKVVEATAEESPAEELQEDTEYLPLQDTCKQYWNDAVNRQTKRSLDAYKELEQLWKARDKPPAKRKDIESKTTWQFHPENPFLIRKKSA